MNSHYSGDFERARRIVKTDEFSSVFRLRPVYRTAHFVLYARPNQLPHARLGVVAAKRLAPRAVTRNTVKRAVREAFRQSELLAGLGLDCVVRLSKALNTKAEPARTAAIKELLHAEVLSLFAIPSKLQRILNVSDVSVKPLLVVHPAPESLPVPIPEFAPPVALSDVISDVSDVLSNVPGNLGANNAGAD